MGKIKKVFLALVIIFLVAVITVTGIFFYLRAKGEKQLKENFVSGMQSDSDGLDIIYDGKQYKYNENIINILCMGIDKDLPIEEKRASGSEGLADAILLVSIDLEDETIGIIGIPRDTIISVKVLDSQGEFLRRENGQITLQYAYGRTAEQSCKLMTEAVSNLLYKLPIHRYCSINLQAVPVLNDAIGGVEVEVLEDIEGEHCTLEAGTTVHLDGYEALDYIQERDTSVSRSSMGRLERQKQYMINYFEQAKDIVKEDPDLPITVYNELQGNMCTNITTEELAYLIPEIIDISPDESSVAEISGEVIQPEKNEEFYVDEESLKALVIELFYEETASAEDEGEND